MKILNFYPILLFVFMTFVLGCNEYIDKYESTWEYQYEQAIAKSLSVEKPANRIFLNFELGMSKKAFEFHEKELLEAGKLRQSDSTVANHLPQSDINSTKNTYFLSLKSGNYPVTYTPFFEKDKLVQLDLSVQPRVSGQELTTLYKEVFDVFKNKYGGQYLEKKQMYGSNDFFWFNSNRQLKLFKYVYSIHMIYSDLKWYDLTREATDNLKTEIKTESKTVIDL